MSAEIRQDGVARTISGRGSGPIDAFVGALRSACGVSVRVSDYREHALGRGADAMAVAYVEVVTRAGASRFGVGRHRNIMTASLEAVTSAVNRAHRVG